MLGLLHTAGFITTKVVRSLCEVFILVNHEDTQMALFYPNLPGDLCLSVQTTARKYLHNYPSLPFPCESISFSSYCRGDGRNPCVRLPLLTKHSPWKSLALFTITTPHFPMCLVEGEVQEDLEPSCLDSSPLQWLLQFLVTLENLMDIHDRPSKE